MRLPIAISSRANRLRAQAGIVKPCQSYAASLAPAEARGGPRFVENAARVARALIYVAAGSIFVWAWVQADGLRPLVFLTRAAGMADMDFVLRGIFWRR